MNLGDTTALTYNLVLEHNNGKVLRCWNTKTPQKLQL